MEIKIFTKVDLEAGVLPAMEHSALIEGEYVLHRDPKEGPALFSRKPQGLPLSAHYYWHGRKHREDGPAYIRFREDGSISDETYWRHGVLHRNPYEGPAWVSRSSRVDPSILTIERYYYHGKPCRDPADGPCYINRDPGSGRILEQYYTTAEEAFVLLRASPRRRRSPAKLAACPS